MCADHQTIHEQAGMPLPSQQCLHPLQLLKRPLCTLAHQLCRALAYTSVAAFWLLKRTSAGMEWLWSAKRTSSAGEQALAPAQKLKEYHDLAKDSIERAYQADAAGHADRAVKLYDMALQAAQEGLKLSVPTVGLSAPADSVTAWRDALTAWQSNVQDRVRILQSRSAGTSQPSLSLSLSRILALPEPRAASVTAAAATRRPASSNANAAGRSAPLSGAGGPVSISRKLPTRQQRPAGSAASAPTLLPTPAAQQSSSSSARTAISKEEERYRQIILGEVLDTAPSVCFADVADLHTAKQALTEAVVLPSLRADIFQGLRAPVRGLLLYGPPGNGKTMLGKALAHEAKATFFNISASSLTSKWVGEGEKLVRALFAVAAERAPSIVFMDEVDSLLSARSSGEHDAMRRLKTEFLVQFDGVASGDSRIVVIGATNRPQELDDAVRRRLVKRIYIPLPDAEGRRLILQHLLKGHNVQLGAGDVASVVRATGDYSASDLTALCKEAAMGPVRDLGAAIASVKLDKIRPIRLNDFYNALQVIKPSTNKDQLKIFELFTKEYGTQ